MKPRSDSSTSSVVAPEPSHCFRIHDPAERLFLAFGGESPLLIHAANAMAGLAAIMPLGELVGSEDGNTLFFPDAGLEIMPDRTDAIHGIDLPMGERSTLSVEFAMRGDPRALAIAAIPPHGNATLFRHHLLALRFTSLDPRIYQKWSRAYTRHPVMCPCCSAAATKRRSDPAGNPIARVFEQAILRCTPLRCTLPSDACGFSSWLLPSDLSFANGRLELTGNGGSSLLEFDPGICHSLAIARRRLDGEDFSVMRLFDSKGEAHLEIATPGWRAESEWKALCMRHG
jgi:hypothetical protein